MLKEIFLISLIMITFSQYAVKKEVDIPDDFTGEVEYRLDKLAYNLERSNKEWKKRGVLNFTTRNKSKTNKAIITMTNEPLGRNEQDLIHKECLANGSYIVRIKVGGHHYYSTLDAVIVQLI
jgi:hypothetical protein